MRPCQSGVMLLLLIGLCGGVLSTAQQNQAAKTPSAKATTSPRMVLLAAEDGLTVLAAALDERNRLSGKADCSHLVHDVYERAGFSYTYVPSSDLYTGIAEFRRTTRPQPGDLVVWPGHVGILISPTQHTFYSSLNSGFGVESYDSAYWSQRGRPRFLRYVKHAGTALAAVAKPTTLKSTSLETKLPVVPVDARDTDLAPVSVAQDPAVLQFPPVLTIASPRPSIQEVTTAVTYALSQAADGLKGQDLFGLPQTVRVLSQIQVQRVKIKNSSGWAELQTSESASLEHGQSSLRKRQQKQRWTLRRRDERNWELLPPQETMYLNQADAVKLLARQLAAMTAEDSSADARRKAQLAALLGSLLQVRN